MDKRAVGKTLRQFFFPSFTLKFLIRALGVALLAYLFFGYLFVPIRIKGYSMEPTYSHGGINFCFKGRYLFFEPKRHDVVAVRFAGNRVMLLKRVVAMEEEWVEFQGGRLLVNGKEVDEPYVRYPCHWNLPARKVEQDYVYVVGDNRSMPIDDHHFGQVSKKRIIGAPVW